MNLVIIPKRINELLEQLNIDVLSIPMCTAEELETLLEEVPTIDKRVLLNFNYQVNHSVSLGIISLFNKYKVEDYEGLMRSYFNSGPIDEKLITLNNYKDIIQYTKDNNLVIETRDYVRNTTVLILDDGLIKTAFCQTDMNVFTIAVTSIQVYNEIVCTGRTPVQLIQRLFKYI